MRIIDDKGYYWTIRDGFGFWSKFKPLQEDKRDFFIITSLVLLLGMRIEGIKAKLRFSDEVKR